MRKFQKQQILEVMAIQIGEAIEQVEGTGTQTVTYLEQYRENAYQTSVKIQGISAQKAYKSLESNLIKAQNAISHMEERKEVAFLPYKNTKKEDIDIPDEWLKVIQKPDDSYKKIIFYNTSINGLLHHEDKMLAKMQDVFATFKDNKDDIALLWRPHPLIKSTISSMRPQLWEAYEKIAAQYIEEGWGIYDDTADLNRAIALCDAYYGDGSSVVQLCQEAGNRLCCRMWRLERTVSA